MGKAAAIARAKYVHRTTLRVGLGTAALLAAAGASVYAAEVGVTNTEAYTESLDFNPATITTNSSSVYSTQVIGRLQGGAPLYDQLFAVPFADPLVQAGLSSAHAAVTAAGGPGIVIGAPQLTASTTNTTSTSVTEYSLVSSVQEFVGVVIIFGPDVITVGQLSACGVSSLPSTTAPTCTTLPGTPYVLAPGETDGQTIWNTVHTIDQDTTITETTSIFEQYTITGVVQAVGVVHTGVQSAALDASGRFLRSMADAAGGEPTPSVLDPLPGAAVLTELDVGGETLPIAVWAEAYGTRASNAAEGSVPGDVRTGGGLAAGVSVPVSADWTMALGLDHGVTSVALDSVYAENATIGLTQIGVAAHYSSGPLVGTLGATLGLGTVDTVHDLGGASTANYNLATFGLLAELGYAFELDSVRLTPSVGVDYTAVHTGAFTETGGMALVAPAHSSERIRAWLGVDIGHTWHLEDGGSLDLSGYGRIVGVLSGKEWLLPVAFAAGGAPMTITGNAEDSIGVDLGLKAAYDFGNGASLFATYDGSLRNGSAAHAGTFGLKVSF